MPSNLEECYAGAAENLADCRRKVHERYRQRLEVIEGATFNDHEEKVAALQKALAGQDEEYAICQKNHDDEKEACDRQYGPNATPYSRENDPDLQ